MLSLLDVLFAKYGYGGAVVVGAMVFEGYKKLNVAGVIYDAPDDVTFLT